MMCQPVKSGPVSGPLTGVTVTSILPLLLFTAVSTLTPGAATTLATASGAHFGFRSSVPLMAGAACGLAFLGAAAGGGLAGLVAAAPVLQTALKAAGSLYLLWLAWRIACSGRPQSGDGQARPTSYVGGVWLMLQNPKGWAITLSAAASFSALVAGPWQLALLLAAAFGVISGLSLCLWCLAGGALGRLLRSDLQWRLLNGGLAVLLAASILPMWL